jgi:hypothetical protein
VVGFATVLSCLLACQPSPSILVSLVPPSAAARIQVLADLDDIPANGITEVPLPSAAAGASFDFVLTLPLGAVGRSLLVGLGARDAQGCLVARGYLRTQVGADPEVVQKLQAVLVPLPAPVGCGDQLPAVIAVTPSTVPDNQSTAVRIDAWGLLANASILLDGVVPSQVMLNLLGQASVVVPARSQHPGPASLLLQNPGGGQFFSTKALSYHAPDLSFCCGNQIDLIPGTVSPRVLAADFNGDGRSDLAIVSATAVDVLLNQGQGQFSSTRTATMDTTSSLSAAGDLNRDGRSDLVFLRSGSQLSGSVLLSRGDGSFLPGSNYSYQPASPMIAASAMWLTDVNHDGFVDVLVSSSSGIVVFPNQGDASFSAGDFYPLYDRRFDGVADFNGDGLPDLVGADFHSAYIYFNRDGGFAESPERRFLTNQYPELIFPADLDLDGTPDLIATLAGGRSAILLNDGAGGFSDDMISDIVTPPVTAVGDLNGDQWPDLITSRSDTWFVGLGRGQFQGASQDLFNLPIGLLAADLSGDGRVDFVGVQQDMASSTFAVLLSWNTSK